MMLTNKILYKFLCKYLFNAKLNYNRKINLLKIYKNEIIKYKYVNLL